MRSSTREDRAVSLGKEIRTARRALRLSQSEVADAAEVSQPYVSDVEKGVNIPGPEVLDRIADALRLSRYTLRQLAGHSGMDGAPPDDREAELVNAYRRAGDADRETILRVVRALLRP